MPFDNIVGLIAWVLEAGGAGIVSYWLLRQLEARIPAIDKLPGEWKRALATVQAVVLGALVAWLGSLLKVYEAPTDAAGWANLLIVVGVTASAGHQLLHGFRELPKRPPAAPTPPVDTPTPGTP